jgi:hypothetical protein
VYVDDRQYGAAAQSDVWDDVDKAVAELEEKGYMRIPANGSPKKAEQKDPYPPRDNQGNVLSIEDCEEGLLVIQEARLRIDEEVQKIRNQEHAANRARKLKKKYDEKEKELKRCLDQAISFQRFEQRRKGIRDFGMPDDDGNRAITELVAQETKQFNDTVDEMKDAVAKRVRDRLDELGEDANDPEVRDRIYEALAEAEIIQPWEPLEF